MHMAWVENLAYAPPNLRPHLHKRTHAFIADYMDADVAISVLAGLHLRRMKVIPGRDVEPAVSILDELLARHWPAVDAATASWRIP